jgi:hypothetical protein
VGLLSFGLAAAAVAASTWLVARALPRGDAVGLAPAMYATLSLAVGLGTVFSAQFVLWMLALGAGALCVRESPIRPAAMLLLPIALLTQAVFPFEYGHLIVPDWWGLALLGLRNLLVLASGVLALGALLNRAPGARGRPPRP